MNAGQRSSRAVWGAVAVALSALLAGVVFAARQLAPEDRSQEPTAMDAGGEGVAPADPAPSAEPVQTDDRPTSATSVPGAPPASPPPAPLPASGESAVAAEEAKYLALRDTVRDQVAAEFERHRPVVAAKCFPRGAEGPSAGITYHVVVDESGQEIARGISESRDGTTDEVRQCLRDAAPPMMKIAPPGRPVSVDVFVSYP